MTLLVWVCSASTVMTAKGSGRRKTSRLDRPSAATTTVCEEHSLVGERTGGTCDPERFPVGSESRVRGRIRQSREGTHSAFWEEDIGRG